MPFDMKAIGAELKKVPWWGYAGGGGAILALAYFIHKDMTSTAAANTSSATGPGAAANSASTTAADQGLQLSDLAGMPYDTYDPGYNSDPYAGYSNPSGYDPYTTPASGTPAATAPDGTTTDPTGSTDTTGADTTPSPPPAVPSTAPTSVPMSTPTPSPAAQSGTNPATGVAYGTIDYSGGEAVPAGGLHYTATASDTVGSIVSKVYGFRPGTSAFNDAVINEKNANPNWESPQAQASWHLTPGASLTLPQVSPYGGWIGSGTGHGGPPSWFGDMHQWPDNGGSGSGIEEMLP